MLTYFLKQPDVVQLYMQSPIKEAAFLFLYPPRYFSQTDIIDRPKRSYIEYIRQPARNFSSFTPADYFKQCRLERRLELLEETKVVLEVVTQVTHLPLEHCDTLYTHSECEAAVLLAVDA